MGGLDILRLTWQNKCTHTLFSKWFSLIDNSFGNLKVFTLLQLFCGTFFHSFAKGFCMSLTRIFRIMAFFSFSLSISCWHRSLALVHSMNKERKQMIRLRVSLQLQREAHSWSPNELNTPHQQIHLWHSLTGHYMFRYFKFIDCYRLTH